VGDFFHVPSMDNLTGALGSGLLRLTWRLASLVSWGCTPLDWESQSGFFEPCCRGFRDDVDAGMQAGGSRTVSARCDEAVLQPGKVLCISPLVLYGLLGGVTPRSDNSRSRRLETGDLKGPQPWVGRCAAAELLTMRSCLPCRKSAASRQQRRFVGAFCLLQAKWQNEEHSGSSW
jgi:hypothetical protein